jgi:hypothetical protein
MAIADAEQNGETKFVVGRHVVWPKDKNDNIIRPSWWGNDGFKMT